MAKSASRARLQALCDELHIPAASQPELLNTAMKVGDGESYLRGFADDLADGKGALEAAAPPPAAAPAVPTRPTSPLASAASSRLQEDGEHFLEALEQILLAAAARTPINEVYPHAVSERLFTPDERLIFRHLKLDDREVLREWHRCDNLSRGKAIAGTPEERQAARARAAAAADKFASEADQLRQQIATLTENLARLERECVESLAEVEKRSAAVAGLLADCVDENLLIEPRRLVKWPAAGPAAYVQQHVGAEPGATLITPPRREFGRRDEPDPEKILNARPAFQTSDFEERVQALLKQGHNREKAAEIVNGENYAAARKSER